MSEHLILTDILTTNRNSVWSQKIQRSLRYFLSEEKILFCMHKINKVCNVNMRNMRYQNSN